MARLAQEPNGGLVIPPDSSTFLHVNAVVEIVAPHRVPTIYSGEEYTAAGGLMQYHRDSLGSVSPGAAYIDRILRGTKPGDLPV